MATKKIFEGFKPKKKTTKQKASDFELMAKAMVTPKLKKEKQMIYFRIEKLYPSGAIENNYGHSTGDPNAVALIASEKRRAAENDRPIESARLIIVDKDEYDKAMGNN